MKSVSSSAGSGAPRAWLRRSPPRSFWRLPLAVAAVLTLANLIWYSLEVFEAVGMLVPEIEDVATVLDNTLMSWPILVLLGLVLIGWLAGYVRLTRGLLYFALVTATVTLLVSMGVLIYTLAYREGDVAGLIWDAALVWVANILVFAFWYWTIDGDHALARPAGAGVHFLFPQRAGEIAGYAGWQPRFADYLFLAFTTSTAFSPTDTAPLFAPGQAADADPGRPVADHPGCAGRAGDQHHETGGVASDPLTLRRRNPLRYSQSSLSSSRLRAITAIPATRPSRRKTGCFSA